MTISAVVIDIEGTVCPISFVKETLFPYFLDKIPSKLSNLTFPLICTSSDDSEADRITSVAIGFPEEVTKSYDSLLHHITDLVTRDIKDPVLKSLQGLVWQIGYANGEILAPVYPDAIKLIESYNDKMYVYSSGSVKAQKLLFGYVKDPSNASKAIDLNPHLSGYFDITTSGFKQESQSYKNILAAINKTHEPNTVLFLSDNVKEVEAAIEAGLQSYIVDRPGNNPLSTKDREAYKVIESFEQLDI